MERKDKKKKWHQFKLPWTFCFKIYKFSKSPLSKISLFLNEQNCTEHLDYLSSCWLIIIQLNFKEWHLCIWNCVCHISYSFYPLGSLSLTGKTGEYTQFQQSKEHANTTQCVVYTPNCKNHKDTGLSPTHLLLHF